MIPTTPLQIAQPHASVLSAPFLRHTHVSPTPATRFGHDTTASLFRQSTNTWDPLHDTRTNTRRCTHPSRNRAHTHALSLTLTRLHTCTLAHMLCSHARTLTRSLAHTLTRSLSAWPHAGVLTALEGLNINGDARYLSSRARSHPKIVLPSQSSRALAPPNRHCLPRPCLPLTHCILKALLSTAGQTCLCPRSPLRRGTKTN